LEDTACQTTVELKDDDRDSEEEEEDEPLIRRRPPSWKNVSDSTSPEANVAAQSEDEGEDDLQRPLTQVVVQATANTKIFQLCTSNTKPFVQLSKYFVGRVDTSDAHCQIGYYFWMLGHFMSLLFISTLSNTYSSIRVSSANIMYNAWS